MWTISRSFSFFLFHISSSYISIYTKQLTLSWSATVARANCGCLRRSRKDPSLSTEAFRGCAVESSALGTSSPFYNFVQHQRHDERFSTQRRYRGCLLHFSGPEVLQQQTEDFSTCSSLTHHHPKVSKPGSRRARSQSLGIRDQGAVDPEQGLTESGNLGLGNDKPGDRPFQARQQKNFRESPHTFPLARIIRANHRVRRFRHRNRGSSRGAAWAGVTCPMYDS